MARLGYITYEPYKGRKLRRSEPVLVYRNLQRKGVWYSIIQYGWVVGHTESILLFNVDFIVQLGGRNRTLKQGVKNVHAFAKGTLGVDVDLRCDGLGHKAGYDPKLSRYFWVDYRSDFRFDVATRMPMIGCGVALLNHKGLTVNEPHTALDISL